MLTLMLTIALLTLTPTTKPPTADAYDRPTSLKLAAKLPTLIL